LRIGYNVNNNKITIQPFVSSGGSTIFAPFDIYNKPTDFTLFVVACKIYNKIGGGTAIDYVNITSNIITTINYSFQSIDTSNNRPCTIGTFSSAGLSKMIVHEFSINDATDSTILSKMAYLRNKWGAI
jgi:hypothetical protein